MVLLVFFLGSRLWQLESDLPPYSMIQYQPIDEAYYTIGGLNLYKKGVYDYRMFSGQIRSDVLHLGAFFANLSCFITLKIFGNNYFGLRMMPVLLSGLIFWLLAMVLTGFQADHQTLKKDQDGQLALFVLFLVLPFFDFSFLLSGRVFEPTVFRMAAFWIVFYFAFRFLKTGWATGLLFGLLSGSAVFWVYPTNAFILLGGFVILLHQKNIKGLAGYLLGIGGAFLIFVLLYGILMKSTLSHDAAYNFFTYSNRVSSGPAAIIEYVKNIWYIFYGNFFRFNTPWLILAMFSIPVYVIFVIRHHQTLDHRDRTTFCYAAAFLLQTVFINDYPRRKMIFLLPLLLIIAYRVFDLIRREKIKFPRMAVFIFPAGLAVLSAAVYVFKIRLNIVPHLPAFNFSGLENAMNLMSVILAALTLWLYLRGKKIIAPALLAGVVIVTQSYYALRYLYHRPTYTYREVCREIGRIAGSGKKAIGGLSQAFQLYNDLDTSFNHYAYFARNHSQAAYTRLLNNAMARKRFDYMIVYADDPRFKKRMKTVKVFDYFQGVTDRKIKLWQVK